jgi:hypothetical protein
MKIHDEHDDDLEPLVNEGAEIETADYRPGEDLEGTEPSQDVANASGSTNEPEAMRESEQEIEPGPKDTL